MAKKYRHVYCFACVNGKKLIDTIWLNEGAENISEVCKSCYPFDPEDSRGNDLRVNYKESFIGWLWLLKWEIEDYFRLGLWKLIVYKWKRK